MTSYAGPAWMLLGLCLLSGFSPLLWIAANFLFWLAPAFYPTDLKRPQGFGAWTLWLSWSALSAFLCREPLLAAGPCAQRAAGVLLFALAYSWWGRPHRRAWLGLLWSTAALWGGACVWTRSYDVAAAGLLIAASASCARLWSADIQEGSWKWLSRGSALFFLALSAAFLLRAAPGSPVFARRAEFWRAGFAQWAARPVTGVGPGQFEKGALRYQLSPADMPSWKRSDIPGLARSQWVGAAAETGAGGLALLVIAIFFSLTGKSSREWERQAAGAAFLALAFLATFEDVLYSPALLAAWFSALACAAPGAAEQESRPFRLSRGIAVLGGVLSLLCADWGLTLRGCAETSSERARRSLARDPAEVGLALAWLERAADDSPRDPVYVSRKAALFKLVGAAPEARALESRAAALEKGER